MDHDDPMIYAPNAGSQSVLVPSNLLIAKWCQSDQLGEVTDSKITFVEYDQTLSQADVASYRMANPSMSKMMKVPPSSLQKWNHSASTTVCPRDPSFSHDRLSGNSNWKATSTCAHRAVVVNERGRAVGQLTGGMGVTGGRYTIL